MMANEIERFVTNPSAAGAIALRRADEAAKVVGRVVPGLDTWADSVRAYARTAENR